MMAMIWLNRSRRGLAPCVPAGVGGSALGVGDGKGEGVNDGSGVLVSVAGGSVAMKAGASVVASVGRLVAVGSEMDWDGVRLGARVSDGLGSRVGVLVEVPGAVLVGAPVSVGRAVGVTESVGVIVGCGDDVAVGSGVFDGRAVAVLLGIVVGVMG